MVVSKEAATGPIERLVLVNSVLAIEIVMSVDPPRLIQVMKRIQRRLANRGKNWKSNISIVGTSPLSNASDSKQQLNNTPRYQPYPIHHSNV
jgi:hypothetical protein